jgi:hypothetical protein
MVISLATNGGDKVPSLGHKELAMLEEINDLSCMLEEINDLSCILQLKPCPYVSCLVLHSTFWQEGVAIKRHRRMKGKLSVHQGRVVGQR